MTVAIHLTKKNAENIIRYMICPFCKTTIDDSKEVCPLCGKPLPLDASKMKNSDDVVELKVEDAYVNGERLGSKNYGGINDLFRVFSGGRVFGNIFDMEDIFGAEDFFGTRNEYYEEEYEIDEGQGKKVIHDLVPQADGTYAAKKKRTIKKETDEEKQIRETKWRTLLHKLYLQFAIQLLFGYTGIPALFRTNKGYGVILFGLFILSIILTLNLNFWYLFILIGYQYLLDTLTILMRILVYKRTGKTFNRLYKMHD